MTWLDLSTYIVQNGEGFTIVVVASFLLGTFASIGCYLDDSVPTKPMVSVVISGSLFAIITAGLSCFIPTHDKLVQVKISKIKNKIVTEENANKAAEEIERIAEKLEEKYLGGVGDDKR